MREASIDDSSTPPEIKCPTMEGKTVARDVQIMTVALVFLFLGAFVIGTF